MTDTKNKLTKCNSCGMAMFGERDLCNHCRGMVPIEELEQLIAELERRRDTTSGHGTKASAVYYRCITELSNLISQYD